MIDPGIKALHKFQANGSWQIGSIDHVSWGSLTKRSLSSK